jgi:hypothetical protein
LRQHLRTRIRTRLQHHLRRPALSNRTTLRCKTCLTQDAISFYSAIIAEKSGTSSFDSVPLQKRSQYYQEKIKRLLVREDVQECLVGKKSNPRASGLQRELARVAQHAPEQARVLLNHFSTHIQQQEKLIQNNL